MSLMSFPNLNAFARTLSEMRNTLEKAYVDELSGPTTTTFWAPRVNVRETQEAIEISADLPGVKKDDLSVQVENNVLILRGTRRSDQDDSSGTYHRIEKVYGSFERTFALPAGLRKDDVSAALKDGVLSIRIPKAEEVKPRQVEIQIQD